MYTFSKKERLCSKKDIDHLFQSGSSFFVHPYRVLYQVLDIDAGSTPVKVLIQASKKKQTLAVDRNRIKRFTREVYRLKKGPLLKHLQEKNKGINLALVYASNDIMKFDQVSSKIELLLNALIIKL